MSWTSALKQDQAHAGERPLLTRISLTMNQVPEHRQPARIRITMNGFRRFGTMLL